MPDMPQNPLPATLQYQNGHVVPVPENLHLHQDQVVHHHYAQPIPTTSAQIGVALAQALGRGLLGLGVAAGSGFALMMGGQVIAVDLIAAGGASIGIAYAARNVSRALGDTRKPPEKPAPRRRIWR